MKQAEDSWDIKNSFFKHLTCSNRAPEYLHL